jgi:hydrogenase/urease accessory protein HupE
MMAWMRSAARALLVIVCSFSPLHADELRPAFLQLSESSADTFDVLWKVPARGQNQRLSLDVVFDDTTRVVQEPLSGFVENNHTTRWQIQRANGLAGMPIAIDGLERSSTEVLVRIEYLDGASGTERLTPDNTRFIVPAKPTWGQTAWTYFVLGVEHILLGMDHLLFVLALLLLVNGFYTLVTTITAFTVAHSITLVLSSLHIIVLPVPPVEASIALSIVFVATEIIHTQQGRPGISARRPWLVAFLFGLLHGLGFAAVLEEIGLPEEALATALITFNLGVEAGQLLFVGALLIAWYVCRPVLLKAGPTLHRVPAYLIGSIAAFWLIQRTVSFWQV